MSPTAPTTRSPSTATTWKFRISNNIAIEIISQQPQKTSFNKNSNNSHTPEPEYTDDGTLKAMSFVNFTGRFVLCSAPESTEHTISFAGALSEDRKDRATSSVSVFNTEESRASSHAEGDTNDQNSNKRSGILLRNLAFMSHENGSTSAEKTEAANTPLHVSEGLDELKDGDPEAGVSTKSPQETSIVSSPRSPLPRKSTLVRNMDVFRKMLANAARQRQKHSIPASIRSQRHQKQLADLRSLSGSPPTKLHELCARPSVTLEELFDCYTRDPSAVKTKDAKGRFPLHILGDNDALIMSDSGREVATVFSGHLMNEHPAVTIAPDEDGFIPFARILADWVDWANDVEKMREEEADHPSTSQRDSSSALFYKGQFRGFFHERHHHGLNRNGEPAVGGNSTHHWHMTSAKKLQFPRVEVWIETDWCFQMLSTAIDILGRNQTLPTFRRARMASVDEHKDQKDDRRVLTELLIQKLPILFCVVLLVDDDGMDTRCRILDMVIFRRLLLCEQTIGKWLIYMLNHGGIPAQRAVDFLWLVSRTTINDFTGGFGAAHSIEWEKFNEEREQVFEAVCNLRGVIASLVTLDIKETERAASTAVVWHTMSSKLARPFVLGLVLIDLVLHLTLMVAYRDVAQLTTTLNQSVEVGSNAVIYFICSHYMLRKGCEGWVLLTVSTSAFNSYFSNIWNVFDTMAIILTLYGTVWQQSNPGKIHTGLNALVVGLLWIKVLGFLKVVNKSMSTFILALAQILYDIRLFMVVLTVCIFMFGDMFHTVVSTKDDGQYCSTLEDPSGTIQDFCTSSWHSYLRVYSILLGDFELDDIDVTTGTTILFIIFTVFGVIILLNVLIAVISDSYEKATMNGSLLFGRARVLYVAQNEALEEFLRPKPRSRESHDRDHPVHRSGHKKARSSLRWTVLLAIIGCAVFALLFLVGLLIKLTANREWFLFALCFFLTWCLFLSLWVVIAFVTDGVLRNLLPNRAENWYDFMNRANSCLVKFLSNKLFGVNKEKVQTVSQKAASDEDWMGRIKYLEAVIQKQIAESKNELKSEIMEMRAEMHEHFDSEGTEVV